MITAKPKQQPCPTCKGGGYLIDRAKGVKFVCTVCDGHGVKLAAPVYRRVS